MPQINKWSDRTYQLIYRQEAIRTTSRILKLLTGERGSSSVNGEVSRNEHNASFIHYHSASGHEPLSLPTGPEDFIKEVNVAKAFQSLKLKSFSGPGRLSYLSLKDWSAVFTDLFQLSLSTGALADSRRTTRSIPLPKRSSMTASSKMWPIACRPVPLYVSESLVLNSIGFITIWPSDPHQFAYKAKCSISLTLSRAYRACGVLQGTVLLHFSHLWSFL